MEFVAPRINRRRTHGEVDVRLPVDVGWVFGRSGIQGLASISYLSVVFDWDMILSQPIDQKAKLFLPRTTKSRSNS
jgi:hypothetical protein